MSRLSRRLVLFTGLLLLTPCLSRTELRAADERPANVLLVTIDTLRADRLGAYGNRTVKTPNLDALAREGVLFENAVAQVPLTPPSHASMFTGTYPTVHGVRDTGGFVLGQSHITLAEILAEQGWQTAAVVGSKAVSRVFGLDQGFQLYDESIPRPDPRQSAVAFAYRRGGDVVDRAIDWLKQREASRPFFLWVHLFDPHAPYDPPPPFRNMYEHPYDGEVSYSDREVGRLFDALRSDAAAAGTLILVLSDHGEGLGDHGEYSHGVFLYESTLRIPWIMSGPGVPENLCVDQQARTIDLLPTVLELLDLEPPEACEGVSLVPSFSGRRTGSTYSYAETLFPKINMGWSELRAIRTNRWKYIRAPKPELYDLEQDPGESVNLLERFPVEVRRLENQLREVLSASGEGGSESVNLVSIDPETAERLRSLGYVSVGTPRRLELTGSGADPKDRVQILELLEETTGSLEKRKPAERIRLLEEARRLDPENPAVVYLLGEAYERSNRDTDALRLYQEAIQKERTATNTFYSRIGGIQGRMGQLDDSILAFEKAVEIDPTDIATQNRLALAYVMKARLEDAERILSGILVLNDQDALALNTSGWLEMTRGNMSSAKEKFDRALESDPELFEAYLNLGLLHRRLGDDRKAAEAFRSYVEKAAGRDDQKATVARIRAELEKMGSKP